ncbi:MAG TPA: efflux RND transporter periplasmic adaptor subunit [Vicinamibacterales bacterium]|nr:efflux RND transporter periplasmic adaptor subunit [Vicinamibacterales bacterium]
MTAPLTLRALHHEHRLHVATAQVTDGPIVRRITATGTLQAVATVQVGAQVSGTIQSLRVDYNAIVHRGEVLATLDPALLQTSLDQANAALAEAHASEAQAAATRDAAQTAVVDAQTKLTRAEQLAARSIIAAADLDSARIAFASARADLQSSESQLEIARASARQAQAAVDQAAINVQRTVITAPIDGIVVSRNVDVGQTVASAVQAPVLFALATDLRRIQVEVDVDESDIAGIGPGEDVSFQVESFPNDVFTGTVSAVRLQPVAEQTTTATTVAAGSTPSTTTAVASVISYATIVDVDNPDEKLRPGMTATVTLRGARRERAVRIPTSALSFRPPADLVGGAIALDAADAARRVVWEYDGRRFIPEAVRVGLADDRWTEMVDGVLHDGDALVTSATVLP